VKRCGSTTCEQPLQDEIAFSIDRARKDGLNPCCRNCCRARYKKYASSELGKKHKKEYEQSAHGKAVRRAYNHSPHRREKERQYNRLPKERFGGGVSMAKRRGWDWNLTFEEWWSVIDGAKCHYCNGELDEAGYCLDRKNNDVGYEIANVVPCCGRCNRVRGRDFDYDEFNERIAPQIREIDRLRSDLSRVGECPPEPHKLRLAGATPAPAT
jgi:hypothetical protein